jgi:hypothetical protein
LRRHRRSSMELEASWLSVCVLFFVMNGLYLRKLDSNIGDPWLNPLLAVIMCLLVRRMIKKHLKIINRKYRERKRRAWEIQNNLNRIS